MKRPLFFRGTRFEVAVALRLLGRALLAPVFAAGCASIPLTRSEDVDVQCRADLKHASELRGLELQGPLLIERETPGALQAALAADLDREDSRAFLYNTGVLLQQLRVLEKGQDLRKTLLDLMRQQVAAYYDPDKKRVAYVETGVTNRLEAMIVERFVYVHEFCHALEDCHFDVKRLSLESYSDFDRNMALTSLLEGNAMLVGLDSVFSELPVNTATPAGALAVSCIAKMGVADEMETMGDCPAFLGGALIRPYLDGGAFANRIRREAGWQAVDRVLESRMPRSTAEILYPEKRYLSAFRPAQFRPVAAFFDPPGTSVLTNRVGAMGIGLWLAGEGGDTPSRFSGFLSGWMGDEVWCLMGGSNRVDEAVWLSYWERPELAKAFVKRAGRRLEAGFNDGCSWALQRKGRLVAIVWSDARSREVCVRRAAQALETAVDAEVPGWLSSWLADCPCPVRFPAYEGHSDGFECLGGHAVDVAVGPRFSRFNLCDGMVLRCEHNPDRRYLGTLGGLMRYVSDTRSDFTFWNVPLLATWFRRGRENEERFSWSVLGGIGGCGDERKARVLFVPVWRTARKEIDNGTSQRD